MVLSSLKDKPITNVQFKEYLTSCTQYRNYPNTDSYSNGQTIRKGEIKVSLFL